MISPPVRMLERSDECQVRLTYLPSLAGIDVRLYRKRRGVSEAQATYDPTDAGLVIPISKAREFLEVLCEVLSELER